MIRVIKNYEDLITLHHIQRINTLKTIISHSHYIHSSEHGHKDGDKREQDDDPG
jgi:hypothetical protein